MVWKLRRAKRLFIPCSANNYRARLLHLPSLVIMVSLFLAAQTILSLVRLSQPAVLGYISQITPEKIVELTNQERAGLGLEELKINEALSEAARRKAADMFAFDYWSHNSPTGRDPWSFFKEVNYDYIYAGENLARDFTSSEAVVAAWMASPTHKDNIINSYYQEIGVAVVEGELEGLRTTLVVQMFGSPARALAEGKPFPGLESVEQAYALTEAKKSSSSELLTSQESPSVYQGRPSPVSPLAINRGIAVFILGLLAGVLLVDCLITGKKNIRRLAGDSWAHLTFLVIILLIVFLSGSGSLLESVSSL
jgi:uncharacterized protein YkwD